MKALRLIRPGAVEIIETPKPEPRPGEVLLKIRRLGLCGTDLNSFRGRNPLVRYPRIPGHEIAATILARGADVPSRWAVGLDVTVAPYQACGRCSSCQAKRFNACRDNRTLGVQRDGALAEFLASPHEKLHTSPKLCLDELALVEPFSIGFHAARRGRVRAGETVLVLGCGPIGLGAVAASAGRGARAIAADLDARKLALARELGAQETIHSGPQDVAATLQTLTEGEGPEVVIEAIGLAQTYRQAVEWAAYGGRVVYIGWSKEPVTYETKLFVAKELDILGSRNALGEFGEVLACFEQRRFDPKRLITHRVTLDEAGAALQRWSEDPAPVTKIMVNLD